MSQTIGYKVIGEETIHCEACEQRIGNALRRLRGVQGVRASSETQQLQVTIDAAQVAPDQVKSRLEQIGYQVTPEDLSQK
jgi:copper chaperone CopZ